MNEQAASAARHQATIAQALLDGALPEHGASIDYALDERSGTFIMQSVAATGRGTPVRLTVGDVHTADLAPRMRFRWVDHLDALVVSESRYAVLLADERQPLVRFEFQEALTATPRSHWHLHAERGARSVQFSARPSARSRLGPTGCGTVVLVALPARRPALPAEPRRRGRVRHRRVRRGRSADVAGRGAGVPQSLAPRRSRGNRSAVPGRDRGVAPQPRVGCPAP